jgi:uracil-DNA glycosylase
MILNKEWKEFLADDLESNSFSNLMEFLNYQYKTEKVYPKYSDLFRAFNLLSPSGIKVIIVGQDPYHGEGQANGLAFSVFPNIKIPPSLRNIYLELVDDLNCKAPVNGDLTQWAEEGVLLINAVLSVIDSKPNSHKNKGWEDFTDSVLQKLSSEYKNIVFILWGASSQKKSILIDESKHLIIKSPHPSPLSSYRGFFKSKPFSKANTYLKEHNKKEIDWCLTSEETLH